MSENVYIVIDQMQTLLDEARAQRDRVVAALRELLWSVDNEDDDTPARASVADKARAALAELEES